MAIAITLYKMTAAPNKIKKTLPSAASSKKEYADCTLREQTSVTDPVVFITESGDLSQFNYAYIPALHRYYFIRNIKLIRTNVWEIDCHVDVLKSYSSGILDQNYCKLARCSDSNFYNVDLEDNMPDRTGKVIVNSYEGSDLFNFSNSTAGYNYVLTVMGDYS